MNQENSCRESSTHQLAGLSPTANRSQPLTSNPCLNVIHVAPNHFPSWAASIGPREAAVEKKILSAWDELEARKAQSGWGTEPALSRDRITGCDVTALAGPARHGQVAPSHVRRLVLNSLHEKYC